MGASVLFSALLDDPKVYIWIFSVPAKVSFHLHNLYDRQNNLTENIKLNREIYRIEIVIFRRKS